MRHFVYLTLAASTFLASPAFAGPVCDAFANGMTRHVVEIFHDSTQSENQKRDALSGVFQQAVDTDWIGKFVLGRFWKTATPEQQTQYLSTYRTYLTHNYISKFNDEDGMSVDDIVITSIAPGAEGQIDAKTLIKRKSDEDVHVDYMLDETGGKCKVHDIKVEGVSLLTTQRSEFSSLAGSSGVQGVIDAMQKKSSN